MISIIKLYILSFYSEVAEIEVDENIYIWNYTEKLTPNLTDGLACYL